MLKSIELRKFPELDSIRFISIFLVVLHHQFLTQNMFLTWLGSYGWVGVDLFFVLSGFLITNLLKAEYKKTNTIQLKNFWLKRMIRLWPSWLFTQAITFPIVYYFSRNDNVLREILYHKFWHYFLHFGNYSYAYFGKLHTLYGHFWSLAVEEHFYVLWPILLLTIFKKPKCATPVLLTMVFIPYGFRVFHIFNNDVYAVIKLSTHTRFDELIWGCVLALNFDKLPKLTLWSEFFVTIFMILLFYTGLQILDHSKMTPYFSEFNFTLIGIACCLFIWIAVNGSQKGLRKILQTSLISKLGILSYGVYLIHVLTNTFIYGLIKNFSAGMDQNLIALINFVIPFFPAYLMYMYIDKKFEVMKKSII